MGGLAYTITFITMTVMTCIRSPEPFADGAGLSVVLPIAWVSALAWAAIGVTLGRFLRPEVAVPAALIISYASYVIPVFYLAGTPAAGTVLSDGRVWLTLQPGDWQLAAKLLFWSGLALLFTAAATSLRKTLETGAWVSISGLTAIAFLGSALSPIPGADDRTCRGDELRVCTDRAHAAVLPQFHSVTANALEVLPEPLRPHLLDPTSEPAPTTLQVSPVDGRTSPSLTIDPDATVATLGEALFYRCHPDGDEAEMNAASLNAWWRITHGISITEKVTPSGALWLYDPTLADAPIRGRRLADLAPSARQAWFEKNGPALSDCTLDDIVWP